MKHLLSEWLLLLLFLSAWVLIFLRVDSYSHSVSDTLLTMIIPTAVLFGTFTVIWHRNGAKRRWPWRR